MPEQTIYPTKDTSIADINSDTNYGSDYLFFYDFPSHVARAFIGFDISTAPASAEIASVTLYMFVRDSSKDSDVPGTIRRITGSWEELTATWANSYNIATGSTVLTRTFKHCGTDPIWDSQDVTTLYKEAKDAGDGFDVELRSEETKHSGHYRGNDFDSREEAVYGGTPQKPYLLIEYAEAPIPPTISSISWTPTGDYTTIAAGASVVESVVGGGTTQLMLVATNPAGIVAPPIGDGEAILQIDQEDPFIVAPGDHFRFNEKEWWALNIVCGPECDLITIADEVAQFEKIPKIGDEIQFAAAIDWHGQEMSTIKWYYAKAPGECFSDIFDLDWEEFAVGETTNMPARTFDAEGDEEIAFLMVTATNMNFATGTLDTLCGPIFNLWRLKPSWWDQLLEAIRTADEEIASPITDLFTGGEIEGWTTPPFECPICKQVFDGEDSELDYAKHLMSHITAFEYGWFGK